MFDWRANKKYLTGALNLLSKHPPDRCISVLDVVDLAIELRKIVETELEKKFEDSIKKTKGGNIKHVTAEDLAIKTAAKLFVKRAGGNILGRISAPTIR
ncbi:MAG TPA: hypothetical protein VNK91_01970 [Burkholderiaceae bacterium]|nr:hypothetical protein [Burkholderiaceae bacterium]